MLPRLIASEAVDFERGEFVGNGGTLLADGRIGGHAGHRGFQGQHLAARLIVVSQYGVTWIMHRN